MTYRIYILDGDDRGGLEMAQTFNDDEAAVAYARELLADAYAAEVWLNERLVARLGGTLFTRRGGVGAVDTG